MQLTAETQIRLWIDESQRLVSCHAIAEGCERCFVRYAEFAEFIRSLIGREFRFQ